MYSYPKTIEQAREYPYQNGRAYMEGCCAMEVNPHHGIANQCGRRKGFGPANLYCKAHTQKAAPGEAGEKG